MHPYGTIKAPAKPPNHKGGRSRSKRGTQAGVKARGGGRRAGEGMGAGLEKKGHYSLVIG